MNYDRMNDPLGEQAQYYNEEPSYLDRAIANKEQEVAVLGNDLYNQGFKPYDPSADTNYNRLIREGKLGNQRSIPASIEDRSTNYLTTPSMDLTDPLINGLIQPESIYRDNSTMVIPNFEEMNANDYASILYALNSNNSEQTIPVLKAIESQTGKDRFNNVMPKVAKDLNARRPQRKTTAKVNEQMQKIFPKEQPISSNAKRVISYEGLEPTMAQLETMRVANPNLYNKIGMANGTTGVSSRYPLFSTSNPLTMVNEQIAPNNKENPLPVKMDPAERIRQKNKEYGNMLNATLN